jgi:hypothetical protein
MLGFQRKLLIVLSFRNIINTKITVWWRAGVWLAGVWRAGVWLAGVWPAGVWLVGVWRAGVWLAACFVLLL